MLKRPSLRCKEVVNETDQNFSKQQLGVKSNETKMLGLSQKKDNDLLDVEKQSEIKKPSKRKILQKLASIYNILGIMSPVTIIVKKIFSDNCDSKISWDWIVKKWGKWEKNLRIKISIPRTTNLCQEVLFGDLGLLGICPVVYAVIQQLSGNKQGLITRK